MSSKVASSYNILSFSSLPASCTILSPALELPSVLLRVIGIPNASELMAGELIDAVELKTPTNAWVVLAAVAFGVIVRRVV